MSQKNWYQMDMKEIMGLHQLNPEKGLSESEVQHKQQEYGANELTEGQRVSPITLLLNQFKDFMMLILFGATLISGLLGEYLDAITIIAIILINGVLGFIQEFRAERSLHSL